MSTDMNSNRRLKIALVSCGLGHINRGVEVSTARWFKSLKTNKSVDVRLFCGGEYPEATHIDNIPRDLLLNTVFAPISSLSSQHIWEFCYGVEQLTFAAGLGSTLLSWQPDIVWTKETPFAHTLVATRPLFNLKYKLIFSNGCGFKPATYAGFDHIQHLHPNSFEEAVQFGIPKSKMTVLPNLIPKPKSYLTNEECKKHFGYSNDDFIVVCVAAWNRYHKRIDYLIEEIAKIQDSQVKLLLCGHPEPDTAALKDLAKSILPGRVQWHTLPADEVPIALKASNVFVLPSLNEAFGGVMIEAIMLEIPVISHQSSANPKFANTTLPSYDLALPGNLAQYIQDLRQSPMSAEVLRVLADTAEQTYGEQALHQQFINMAKLALHPR